LLETESAEAVDEKTPSPEGRPETVEPKTTTGAGDRILNVGQQVFDNVQGLLGIRSEAYVKSKAVIRDLGDSKDSLQYLIERAKRKLIENTTVEEIELRALAQERANQIKGYLIEQGTIANERVFIIDANIGQVSDGISLRVDLALSG
jgi:hypothetical protein